MNARYVYSMLLLGALRCAAAEPDYFPLQNGNRWVLQAASPQPDGSPELLSIEVQRSRVRNGETWFLVTGYAPGGHWLRKAADGGIYELDETSSESRQLARLTPQTPEYQTTLGGCRQPARPAPAVMRYDGTYVSSEGALTIQYQPGFCRDIGITQEVYAPSVGLVHRSITTFAGERAFDLVYGRVNGVAVLGKTWEIVLRDDFRNGARGWLPGFADYNLRNGDLRMVAEHRVLPDEATPGGRGFYLQSMNRSDDMFMFLKKQVSADDGLLPNQVYTVSFDLRYLSNAPNGCAGVGGSPGDSVYLKLGASADEAVPSVDASGDIRLRVDKGNQSTGGKDASVAGTIGNGTACEGSDFPWVRVRKNWTHPVDVRADEHGFLWLLMGTDSAYEGLTGLYFESVTVRLKPAGAIPASARMRPLL